MRLWRTLIKYLKIAYRPSKVGFDYEEAPADGATKAIVEAMSAVLILYASYSELSEKFLKAFFLSESEYAPFIGRVIMCVLGGFVCLHILFSTKTGRPTIFSYSRIPRLFAGVIFWLVLVSLVWSLFDFFSQRPAIIGQSEAYYEVPAKFWRSEQTSAGGDTQTATYVCRLSIPEEYKDKYRDVAVLVAPARGFTLKDVSPKSKENKVIARSQEPLEVGRFHSQHSEWLFPDFSEENEWELVVVVERSAVGVKFTDQPPVSAIVYFYK